MEAVRTDPDLSERALALPISSLQRGLLVLAHASLLRETPPALLSGDPGETCPRSRCLYVQIVPSDEGDT
jgi:hypothetical protein